jgi:hypothetical protein
LNHRSGSQHGAQDEYNCLSHCDLHQAGFSGNANAPRHEPTNMLTYLRLERILRFVCPGFRYIGAAIV